MAEPVTIAVDVMGGDRGPAVVLRGALQALEADPDLRLTLVGPAEEVEPFAAAHDRATAQAATEVIEMGEHPAGAVRAKKDSSIVVGCRLVKEGAADGFFSAGSTGACLAAATLVVGRIKGVKRPALGQVIPAWARPTLLIDVGANADCKPEYLVQFAQMGEVYMNAIMGVERPKVGLLNIGEEDTKGDLFAQEAHRLLSETVPAFAGNCEGGDLMAGDFDVVVTDGFTGNVCLKTIEGTAKTLMRNLKAALMSTALSKVGALLVKGPLGALKEKMSPDTYGGTPLLGVKGAVIVGHGSSNETAVKNLTRLGKKKNMATSVDKIEGGWLITFGEGDGAEAKAPAATPEAGSACSTTGGCGYSVFVGKDFVGDGDLELGRNLMKMALYTLSEAGDPPTSLLFMNAGVKLVAPGEEQVIEAVKKLEEQGTEVLVCGTCLNFFGIADKLSVGEVSNMYDILERMRESAKTITL